MQDTGHESQPRGWDEQRLSCQHFKMASQLTIWELLRNVARNLYGSRSHSSLWRVSNKNQDSRFNNPKGNIYWEISLPVFHLFSVWWFIHGRLRCFSFLKILYFMNIIESCAYKIIFYDEEKGTGSTHLKQTISPLNSVIKNHKVCGPENHFYS